MRTEFVLVLGMLVGCESPTASEDMAGEAAVCVVCAKANAEPVTAPSSDGCERPGDCKGGYITHGDGHRTVCPCGGPGSCKCTGDVGMVASEPAGPAMLVYEDGYQLAVEKDWLLAVSMNGQMPQIAGIKVFAHLPTDPVKREFFDKWKGRPYVVLFPRDGALYPYGGNGFTSEYEKLSRDRRAGRLTDEEYRYLRDNMPSGDHARNLTVRELEALEQKCGN